MQKTLRGAVVLACLLAASAVHAEDKPKQQAEGRPGGEPKGRAAEHMERAGHEMKEASKAAREEAHETMQEAREQAHKTMQEAREEARQVVDEAKQRAATSTEGAQVALEKAGDEASKVLEAARERARTLLEEAREQARQALLGAAASLESKERKDERDRTRAERRTSARAESWRGLRGRLRAATPEQPGAPVVAPALQAELRTHARRTAHLARIRALADQAKDAKAVARCDALLAKELGRHERRMSRLIEKSEPQASDENKAEKEQQP